VALHYAEENPDEVIGALVDKTEAELREFDASTSRRAVRCAVEGIVPEGHLRSQRTPTRTHGLARTSQPR
jgi:hypothetical protein